MTFPPSRRTIEGFLRGIARYFLQNEKTHPACPKSKLDEFFRFIFVLARSSRASGAESAAL